MSTGPAVTSASTANGLPGMTETAPRKGRVLVAVSVLGCAIVIIAIWRSATPGRRPLVPLPPIAAVVVFVIVVVTAAFSAVSDRRRALWVGVTLLVGAL